MNITELENLKPGIYTWLGIPIYFRKIEPWTSSYVIKQFEVMGCGDNYTTKEFYDKYISCFGVAQVVKLVPENSEYRGNSRSGQSREIDLIEKLRALRNGCIPLEPNVSQRTLKKINEIIEKVNQLSKLVTIIKEQTNKPDGMI